MFPLQLAVVLFLAVVIPVILGIAFLLIGSSWLPPKGTKVRKITFYGLCIGLVVSVILAALVMTKIDNNKIDPVSTAAPTPFASPSATSEASPSPIPKAPTITPMSKADELARDNFGSALSGWDIISESYGSSGYKDGKYFIALSEYRLFAALWQGAGPLVDNTVLEVDVLGPLDTSGGTQGLVFGWHKNWQGTTYAFAVNGDGECTVRSITDRGRWTVIANAKIQQFEPGRPYHTLRATLRNSLLQGYVNGELCIQQHIPDYKLGYVGVAASPDLDSRQDYFEFDEFRFYQIP